MTTTAVPISDQQLAQICRASHEPWVENGEKEVGDLLTRLGYEPLYESRFYALEYQKPDNDYLTIGGFTPDFHIPATPYRPAFNVEVTMADHGFSGMPRSQFRKNQQRLEIKRLKINLTAQKYEIETILVTYEVLMKLRRNPRHMHQLVRNAYKRHRNRQLQRLDLSALIAA
jgi:hypothetical protein